MTNRVFTSAALAALIGLGAVQSASAGEVSGNDLIMKYNPRQAESFGWQVPPAPRNQNPSGRFYEAPEFPGRGYYYREHRPRRSIYRHRSHRFGNCRGFMPCGR